MGSTFADLRSRFCRRDSGRAAEPPLRVMTLQHSLCDRRPTARTPGPSRKELLLEIIRKFDPDLLGTQEVLAVQADFLAKSLPGYTLVGVGRDDGKRKGEFSALMFYKATASKLVDSGTFWLSETPGRGRQQKLGQLTARDRHLGPAARPGGSAVARFATSQHALGPSRQPGPGRIGQDHSPLDQPSMLARPASIVTGDLNDHRRSRRLPGACVAEDGQAAPAGRLSRCIRQARTTKPRSTTSTARRAASGSTLSSPRRT